MPIAPTKISLPRNRTATILQPSCRTHYCGQTIDFSFCISWQNNKRRTTQFLGSAECKYVVQAKCKCVDKVQAYLHSATH